MIEENKEAVSMNIEKIMFDDTAISFESKSDKELRKAVTLFQLLSHLWLVRLAGKLALGALKAKLPIQNLIKNTIYKQFCGGSSVYAAIDTALQLNKFNIKSVLDYAVEGANNEDTFETVTNEIIKNIKTIDTKTGIEFISLKLTGIANSRLLERKALWYVDNDKIDYKKLEDKLDRICKEAFNHNFNVFIDAEESWLQDNIDGLAILMMQRYNKTKPVVFNSLQMYRHDRLPYLQKCLKKAQEGNYLLGIKLVRGAYLEKEQLQAERQGYKSPVYFTKQETDNNFDAAIDFCMEHIEIITVCAATHNEISTRHLIKRMEEKGISPSDKHVFFSQLLGMSENITYTLALHGYNVSKYLPYGSVEDMMPYLIRRAEENTAIAGQMSRELFLITKELTRRKKANQH